MTPAAVTGSARCERCGTPQDQRNRFCPECGLPQGGAPVLSTQIDALRRHARTDAASSRFEWSRTLALASVVVMAAVVVGVGLLLFNDDVMRRFFPPEPDPPAPVSTRQHFAPPSWCVIPTGEYQVGPPGAPEPVDVPGEFYISKFEITNALWHRFLREDQPRLRDAGIWKFANPGEAGGWTEPDDGVPAPSESELDLPVRNVSALAAIFFCEWLTRRIAERDWVVRLPTREEWEIAAGGSTGSLYPWGDSWESVRVRGLPNLQPPVGVASGDRPVPVAQTESDLSAYKVCGMGSNVAELVFLDFPTLDSRDISRAKTMGVKGASFAMSVERAKSAAQAWFNQRDIEPRVGAPDVGFRVVKVRK